VRRLASLIAGLLLMVQGCIRQTLPPPPQPRANPHYVLGAPYQRDGTWFYPSESYALQATGIAAVETMQGGLTADGELRDPTALTAAMQTIQLPAIVQITNLENGRQILVRVNDRGPASPGRIIAVSPRAALLLQMPPEGVARVRVQVDETLSHNVVDQLGGGPKLQIDTAPTATITAESLPGPGGAGAGPAHIIGGVVPEIAQARVPDRLPERIVMTYADPGELYLRCGAFGRATYANEVAAQLSGLGADVLRSQDGRQTVYAVRVGPFATIAQADRALAEALRDGVIDARITVE
jgi:rare lipoprotein A